MKISYESEQWLFATGFVQADGYRMKKEKLLNKIIRSPKNIKFQEFITLVEAYGFQLSRTRGSHHIFVHSRINELLNVQNVNGQAKPYQIKQFLDLVERYNLQMEVVQ